MHRFDIESGVFAELAMLHPRHGVKSDRWLSYVVANGEAVYTESPCSLAEATYFILHHGGPIEGEWRMSDDPTLRPWEPQVSRRKTSPTGSVYFIQADNGYIKIGYTQDVAARIETLRGLSPTPLHLIGTITGTLSTERKLHSRFSHCRDHGEWFRPDTDLIAFISEEVEQ